MAELLQNREQNIEHVGIYIAEHRTQFPCITGALEHPIAGMQHRSVWLGLSRGGDSNIKKPGCVCLVSEKRPILNDTLSCKTYPY